MTLSVVLITHNEESNLARTLASVKPLLEKLGGEIIVVDSGSTDSTREIAESFGARVFVEEWKGFAAQKNSAIAKAQGDWVLLLDADEEVSEKLREELRQYFRDLADDALRCPLLHTVPRQNHFLGRWIKHGGYWPDRKLRIFPRGMARVEDRTVHETVVPVRPTKGFDRLAHGSGIDNRFRRPLIHHAYPTLEIYLEHMRRYADLGAEMLRHKPRLLLWLNRWLNPPLTFFYNYIFRLGFLDGREGLLLHWHHSCYVAWKYSKALELQRAASRH